jgi:hypothetical protein
MAEFAVGDMIEALGWSGSALIVASLTLRRPGPFRAVNRASAVVLLAFNLAIGLWSMVVLNVAILAVNAWHLGRLVRRPPALDPAPPQEGWYIRTQARAGGTRATTQLRRTTSAGGRIDQGAVSGYDAARSGRRT